MIGVCAVQLSSDKRYVVVRYNAIPIIGDDMVEKYRCAVGHVSVELEFLSNGWGPERAHFIEERLGNFTSGMTTMQTLMKLAQMNAVITHRLSVDGPVKHIHPATAKRLAGLKVPKGGDKKAEAVKLAAGVGGLVLNLTKKGNLVRGTDDMADAWLLAVSGAKLLSGEASIDEQAEAARPKKSARQREAKR